MIRLLGCALLCVIVQSDSIPYRPALRPYGHPGVVTQVSPINPASPLYPYAPGRNPLVPGYNNPLYNAGVAVPILTYSNERGIDSSYSYSFSTADGKQAQESGFLKDGYIDNNGEPQGTQVVEGSYAYISPEGTPIQVNYVADEYGFRPSGVHIPADGKGVVPLAPVGLKDPKGVYNPLNDANLFYAPYDNPLNPRPYDPLYPYDPRYPHDPKQNLYNSNKPWGLNREAKKESKKETA